MPLGLKETAVKYAERGRAVFPVHTVENGACSCRLGLKCERAGKHPRTRNGLKDASTDTGVIEGWWTPWPDSNIGLVTGAGLGVIDVDPRSGGDESFAALYQQEPLAPNTPAARTGGGGSHFYVTVPEGTRTTILADGLDLKCEGGYVLAPPSLHASGDRYEWIHRGRLTPAPSWAFTKAAPRLAAATPAQEWVRVLREGAAAGSRNQTAVRLAGHLARKYLDPDVILELVALWNQGRCRPPLDDDEVGQVVGNVLAAEARRRSR